MSKPIRKTNRKEAPIRRLRRELSGRTAGRIYASDLEAAVYNVLRSFLLRARKPLRQASFSGFGRFEEIERKVRGFGLRLMIRSESEEETRHVFLARGIAASLVRDEGDGEITVRLATAGPALLAKLRNAIAPLVTRRPPRGEVVLLAQGPTGLLTRSLGRLEAPLERENYAPEVVSAYEHVLAELRSDAPCGRFVLLEGPPGTGKSWFVRGLASESEALFVFVSAELMGRMSAPAVVPTLLRERERRVPIVLILEDADLVIVKRAVDNMSMVSDLCSLSDGLLAELIDVRIVATTNARRVEIDDAIVRPGRLCTHVVFAPLALEPAERVYRRLTGQERLRAAGGSLTIAEVYRLARRDGWRPPPRRPSRALRSGRIGFDPDDSVDF